MKKQTRREFLKTVGSVAASGAALSLLPSCASIGQTAGPKGKRPNGLGGSAIAAAELCEYWSNSGAERKTAEYNFYYDR
jgi:hypothetical protein